MTAPQSRQILLAVIALGGISTVVLGAKQSSGASLHGDVLALINLGLWTAYFVRVKQVRNQGVHAGALIAGVFCVAALVVSPWVLLTSHDLGAIHGTDWLSILAMVLVSGLVGHGLMTWAQRHLDITFASLLTLGSPVISAIGAWIAVRPAAQQRADRRLARGARRPRRDRAGGAFQRRSGRHPVVDFSGVTDNVGDR